MLMHAGVMARAVGAPIGDDNEAALSDSCVEAVGRGPLSGAALRVGARRCDDGAETVGSLTPEGGSEQRGGETGETVEPDGSAAVVARGGTGTAGIPSYSPAAE